MAVEFQQWRDATLRHVRRLISLLRSTQGSDPSDYFSRVTQYYIGLELEELQRLVDTPPPLLEADAMMGLLRLASLCEELPIVPDEATRSFRFDYPKLVSWVNDLASPMGIDRIERIANLLDDAEPPPPEAPAELPVTLGKPGDEPIVRGKRKDRLTLPRYNVIKALLAAGDDGLSKDSLATESGCGDAVGILKRLAESDPDWKTVIKLAGKPGGRYRISD